ncbi:MAG: hypothetical protein MH137_11110 [Flavobacteriales bacterium]|nr:hypothetical protein [Flavobacteriales bacterium]
MIKKYVTLPGQTLELIALMRYGAVEAVFTLVDENPGVFANWHDSPAPGTVYFIKSAPINQKVADFFAENELKNGALPTVSASAGPMIDYIWRHDYVSNIIYAGAAPVGTSESTPIWQIDKIELNTEGEVVITTGAIGSWTDRLTLIYS